MATPAQIKANRLNAVKGGRKKGRATLEAEAMRNMIAIALHKHFKPILNKAIRQASDGDKFAREWLTDRAFGKVSQAVELSGKDGGPLQVETVKYED